MTTNDPLQESGPKTGVGFMQSLTLAFKNFANFDGRSSRSAFWWFFLWTIFLSMGVEIGRAVLGEDAGFVLDIAFMFALLIPNLSITVRRLHDSDRSGWWILLWLVPIIGWVALIYFYVQPSTDGDNTYGARKEAGLV